MQCKRCGAEIVPLTIYVETSVMEEAKRTQIPPYIVSTHMPAPDTAATSSAFGIGWSYPCHHEPAEGRQEIYRRQFAKEMGEIM